MPTVSQRPNTIHVLPDEVANQIAAGEVVERPMSVVKELVENSIDAGATRILIEVENGGKSLIRVTDNGLGMSAEDAPLSFSRHATSKVSRAEDLEGITTLGFRGEALPSIASVSRVRLTTSHDESKGGTLVTLEGSKAMAVKDTARSRGSTLEVAGLFYNTPARKKFLKADGTEFSHIAQVVTQQALAYPNIHFTLNHNGKEFLNLLPTGQLLYRIAELFGSELAKELVRVEAEAGDYRLEGFISSPVYTRSSRSAQYCFVNRRYVRDKVILHSTQQGYSHLLPKGQHPVIFLFLSMDPKLFDVNVHPAKAEVRFAYQQEVHRFVSQGVRNGLSRSEKGATAETQGVPSTPPSYTGSGSARGAHAGSGHDSHYSPSDRRELSHALDLMYKSPADSSRHPAAETPADTQFTFFDRRPSAVSDLIYSDFEPVGQLDNSFILLQGKKGVVVVDQHIAHERVLYERFRNSAQNRKVEIQQLLFPLSLEFTVGEAQLLSGHLDRLRDLGLELEPFGENGFLLRTVPAILKNADYAEIMREIVELLPQQGQTDTLDKRYEEILVMMACRNAIKVNMPLELDQIRKLLSDLEQTEMPYTCPHGRPIALLFDMDDILKRFLRK